MFYKYKDRRWFFFNVRYKKWTKDNFEQWYYNRTISVKENSLEHGAIKNALEANLTTPAFVEFDKTKMTGKYVRLPERSELNADINESLIVEFYNR